MSAKRLVVIDDDIDLTFLLGKLFKDEGFECQTATNGKEGLEQVKNTKPPLVICDFRLPDIEGIELLKQIRDFDPRTQVIMITGYSDVRLAVKTIKLGAFDYVTKPILPDEIVAMAHRAIEKHGSANRSTNNASGSSNGVSKSGKKAVLKKGDKEDLFEGSSPAFKQVRKMVDLVAPTNMSVIIEGETGAGKEIIARMLHEKSSRSGQPFVAVDCGAIPESLVASELFGHVKGAFTGATRNKKGHFLRANKGTLLLDEIGNLSYDIQAQLLRALQENVVQRVGEEATRKLDIRLIVAANEPIMAKVEDGSFRMDLYHRLNEFKITVPPLREREEDILGLADHFLKHFNEELNTKVEGFDESSLEVLEHYPWPGNIRELRNVVQRAVLLAQKGHVQKRHLPDEIIFQLRNDPAPTRERERRQQKTAVEEGLSFKEAANQAQAEIIMNALRSCNFNRGKAAAALNIDRKTLYNKIKKLGLEI